MTVRRCFLLLVFLALPSFSADPYTYWIEPCPAVSTACNPGDIDLARWALEAWGRSATPALPFRRVEQKEQALFRVFWDNGRSGLYGEARPIRVGNRMGAELHIRTDVKDLAPDIRSAVADDPLMRDTIVYLTCLHESGHALGLRHNADFSSIMYSFQFGGDLVDYFRRYRRTLKGRDDIQRQTGISAADREELSRVIRPE